MSQIQEFGTKIVFVQLTNYEENKSMLGIFDTESEKFEFKTFISKTFYFMGSYIHEGQFTLY